VAAKSRECKVHLARGWICAELGASALLPEKTEPIPVVPEWPQFIRGCVQYRQSLDEQAPLAPRIKEPYSGSYLARPAVAGPEFGLNQNLRQRPSVELRIAEALNTGAHHLAQGREQIIVAARGCAGLCVGG